MSIPQNDIREIIACKKENGKIVGVFVVILVKNGVTQYMTLKEINDEQAKFASTKPKFKPLYTLKIEDHEHGGYHASFVCVEKFGEQYEIREIHDKVPSALRNLPERNI